MKFSNLLQYFIPKEKKFYASFNTSVAIIVEASEELVKMVNSESEEERKAIRLKIKTLEKQGDKVTDQIFDDLNSTFITPFDREDIHELASNLDDVLDAIHGCSDKIDIYHCTTFGVNMKEMVKWVNIGCIELQKAVVGLEGHQKPEAIMAACEEINKIENRGDEYYHLAISYLFDHETNAIELIRQKEVLQNIEKAHNKIEDVSDVIRTILVKYA